MKSDSNSGKLLKLRQNISSRFFEFISCLEMLGLNQESRELLKEIDEYVNEYERGQEELLNLEFEEQRLVNEYGAVKVN